MIKIDDEFVGLIPPLTKEEYKQLEENIMVDGCRESLVVWKDTDILVDGHNRYKICTENDIEFSVTEKEFSDRSEVVAWIIKNQLGRRNLTPEQVSYLRGKRYLSEKKSIGRPSITDDSDIITKRDQNDPITSEKIAKEVGVGSATIKRDAKFAEAVDKLAEVKPEIKSVILTREETIPKKEVMLIAKDIDKDLDLRETFKTEVDSESSISEAISKTEEVKVIKEEIKPKPKSTFNRTTDSIEWAKWTWNPVTGCKHGCQYCYARDIANRFYPEKFEPTYRPERLDAPKNTPHVTSTDIGYKNVFVCSMADLFGEWVPKEWIDSVIKSVEESPDWNFLFLTKNPSRLTEFDFPPNAWVGTTVDVQSRVEPAKEAFKHVNASVKFLSCEPLRENLVFGDLSMFDWIIIGGQSKSTGEDANQPDYRWVADLMKEADRDGLKIYMKPNLNPSRLREYPE